jgi:OmcA/MtrC family decaheme c-type cytochrome
MQIHILRLKVFTSLIVLFLVSCSGGGGNAVSDVTPESPPVTSTPAPDPIQKVPAPDFVTSSGVVATITNSTISGPPTVEFAVTDIDGVAIVDLTTDNIRFTIAKLLPRENGSSTAWQSYINLEKVPAVNPDNPSAIQATSESGGELINNGDGTYVYTFVTDITNVVNPMQVTYEPDLTHRVAIKFSGGPPVLNPTYDWVPSSGLTSGILTRDIVAAESCNNCHDPLALHGGGSLDTKYCVTCHNPGTTEPNSMNTMDFKVMVHKLHRGRNLPAVQAGGEYVIYGYRDSRNDYSHVLFPQDIRNCTSCHAGTITGSADQVLTVDGDNWSEIPSRAACGSCHDDIDFTTHNGGQLDDSNCASCHRELGAAGSLIASHRVLSQEGNARFKVNILSITNTTQGAFPVINFSVTNPENNDEPYNILTDHEWNGARMSVGLAWSTSDYTNIGNGGTNANMASTDVLENAVSNGDGTFTVVSQHPIPDGSKAPGVAVSGSGTAVIESSAFTEFDGNMEEVPVDFATASFSINESDGVVIPRRQVVDIQKCNACHKLTTHHENNRTNNIEGCAGCHNPRNTDRNGRAIAQNPPTDGKQEESIDLKRMIHGIHAADFRINPLQVVGFNGLETLIFDHEAVAYPGRLNNCNTCHVNDSFELPLNSEVLGSTIDTGTNRQDPSDDLMITPTAAVCSACHDSSVARSHMEQNGGDFTATLQTISSGASTETCASCHGPGEFVDLKVVHDIDE